MAHNIISTGLNTGNTIFNSNGGILISGDAVKGGYFVTDTVANIPSWAEVIGTLCYCKEDSKFYQFNGTTWAEKEFGTTAVASQSAPGLMSSEDKKKLDGITAGAEVNVQSDWSVDDTSSDAFIKNKPNVIIEGDSRLTDARTPKEHTQAATTITEDTTHRFVTDTEKSAWNAKSNFSGDYNDLTNKPTIPTKSSLGLDKVTNDAQVKRSEMGTANGVATLGSDGRIPTSQLPSYVDDVLEYTNKAAFPTTGESGKIYVDITENKTYRWSGSTYTEISASLALGETSSTAYRGDRGKVAYDHSQTAHAPVDAEKNVQSDWNVTDSTSDAFIKNKPAIPTVNNGTLTIQKNGVSVQTFTANQSSSVVANITVPTKVSELTNDSGFKTTDNNTTYDLAAAKSKANGNVTIDLIAGGSGSGTDSVQIKGSGTTTVTTDANGVITINSVNTDTGVTSVEVVGAGNAIATASYNATTRKLTLTKSDTYITETALETLISSGTEDPSSSTASQYYFKYN